ncbi:hypothetical protein VOLCADRAFT_90218 [Volvox carteri f. nagariensis]|uniref:Uncharacterized protein n=1 Tax=Volvox carteri f. nagariensis TaxID=3068 RepID=D8TTS9_VOLCA|nr:uncharacterized protein VOLCADRAFT_90218 [Volvox carteri f. nagariensis]EFJ49021.1 hypothetical protein VOLCADRAFT_90218 [Volvox carteri f. nagariensis]|eukprot:XP_002949918.1 hypothetical protein VOLCADRAFT_90218 [Volvox carteri f. nagariensis]
MDNSGSGRRRLGTVAGGGSWLLSLMGRTQATPSPPTPQLSSADATRKAQARANWTPEQVAADRAAAAARWADARANRTPEQVAADQAAATARWARWSEARANRTPEQVATHRAAHAARVAEVRANRTPEQVAADQTADAARKHQARAIRQQSSEEHTPQRTRHSRGSLVEAVLNAAFWVFRRPTNPTKPRMGAWLDSSTASWPEHVQDVPAGQPLPTVPLAEQIRVAEQLDAAVKNNMPSCVCACCSEMKSAVQAHGYRFGDIPNVHQLRADVWRMLAVARPAQVVAWLPVAAAPGGRTTPPPEPALPWGF